MAELLGQEVSVELIENDEENILTSRSMPRAVILSHNFVSNPSVYVATLRDVILEVINPHHSHYSVTSLNNKIIASVLVLFQNIIRF